MKNREKKDFKNKLCHSGYSFVEGIVATFIVTAGMLAVIQLMSANLLVLLNSRNQTTATFLAQEGAEIVRNIRDNNWASHNQTFNNLPNGSRTDCRVDIYSSNMSNSACNNGNGGKRLQKDASGLYSHVNGNTSLFQRKIIISYDTGNSNTAAYATVTSVVNWGTDDLPDAPSASNCNLYNHCVYTSVVLNKWGGSD